MLEDEEFVKGLQLLFILLFVGFVLLPFTAVKALLFPSD